MAHTAAIDEAAPANTDPASGGDVQFRSLKRDVRERLELEHYWNDALSGDQQDGGHTNITQKGTGVVANKELLKSSGYSLTAANAHSAIDLAGTWNTTGKPSLLKADVLDTASDADSLLMDLKVSGVEKFSVSKAGVVKAAGVPLNPPTTAAWPIGGVFIAVVPTNPATLLGYGTWVACGVGRVLVGIDPSQTEFDTLREVGGAKTHALSAGQMPTHTHVQTAHVHTSTQVAGNANYYDGARLAGYGDDAVLGALTSSSVAAVNQDAGGGAVHNNLQPYLVVYMWERTA